MEDSTLNLGDGSTEHCDALKIIQGEMGRTGNGFAHFFSKAGNPLDYILALIETILYLVTCFVLNLGFAVDCFSQSFSGLMVMEVIDDQNTAEV